LLSTSVYEDVGSGRNGGVYFEEWGLCRQIRRGRERERERERDVVVVVYVLFIPIEYYYNPTVL